jgi:ketosteroid isomerase-like protein
MSGHGMTPEDTVRAYLRAIERMDVDEVDGFFHRDVTVVEHPNKLNPAGKTYDRAALREAGERGKALLQSQRYEVRGIIASGTRVCAQTEWIGVTKTGVEIRAHICSVFDLVEGAIWRQEQYDCFS